MPELVFCPGVTLWQLNPLNHALRNDYSSNLITLAIEVLPKLHSVFGNVAIEEGFVSMASSANDAYKVFRSTGNMISIIKPLVGDVELINGIKKVLEAIDDDISVCINQHTVKFWREKSFKRIFNDEILVWKK